MLRASAAAFLSILKKRFHAFAVHTEQMNIHEM
jgi:hypothetical protein